MVARREEWEKYERRWRPPLSLGNLGKAPDGTCGGRAFAPDSGVALPRDGLVLRSPAAVLTVIGAALQICIAI